MHGATNAIEGFIGPTSFGGRGVRFAAEEAGDFFLGLLRGLKGVNEHRSASWCLTMATEPNSFDVGNVECDSLGGAF